MKPIDTSDVPEGFYPTAADVAAFTTGAVTSLAIALDEAGVISRKRLGEIMLMGLDDKPDGPAKFLTLITGRGLIAIDKGPPELSLVEKDLAGH